jgi:predicted PurR-regulated permease PerM
MAIVKGLVNSSNMKIKQIIISVIVIVFLGIAWLFLPNRDEELIKQGNEIIQEIEQYQSQHGSLPASLNDIGFEVKMEGPIYYQVVDSSEYEVWFGRSLGESFIYNSKAKEWQEK